MSTLVCTNTIVTEDGDEFTTDSGELFVAIPLRGRQINRVTGLPHLAIDNEGVLRHSNFQAESLDALLDELEDDGNYRVIRLNADDTFEFVLDIEPV